MRRFFNFLRDYTKSIDNVLLFLCIASSLFGLVLIYSACLSYNSISYVLTQALAIAIGAALYLILSAIDCAIYARLWPGLLLVNLLFLSTLYFWGVGESNRGWLRFGSIGIQPGEAGKLVFILTFSAHLSAAKKKGMGFLQVLGLIAHAGVCMGFVMFFSRDDGMTLSYAAIALATAFYAGVPLIYFLFGAAAASAALPYAWDSLLDQYQKSRILAVFAPEQYPDAAYQALHSRMAIKSGGLFGKGYLSGTQTQYGLIPTKHTDSIFPVAGEEFGILGCALIIALLTAIILRIVFIIRKTEEDYPKFIIVGISSMLVFQTVLNLGMNLGIFPIVGLTLPFFSYGGSSIVTMFACAGVASGIRRQNKLYSNKQDVYIRRYR